MNILTQDIHPKAEKALIELLRQTSTWQKCQQVSQMIQTCRQLSLAGLRVRYPDASEEEILRRLAALWLPRELVIQVYGWDPDIRGY